MSKQTELSNLLGWVQQMTDRVRELAYEWKDREGNLIMVLHAIQDEFGYVPRSAANELSKILGIRMARVYEVITFYHYFRLTPPGTHTVQVCMGTACYLKGAESLHQELGREIKQMEASGGRAGDFRLETVRCIGCCGMAPAVVVDTETHGRLSPDTVGSVLKQKRGS